VIVHVAVNLHSLLRFYVHSQGQSQSALYKHTAAVYLIVQYYYLIVYLLCH